MGNFRRHRESKSKVKNRKKPAKKEKEEKEVAGDQAGGKDDEEEAKKNKTMVVLQCDDGVELVVPKEEASRYGTEIEYSIRSGHYDDAYVDTRSSCNKDYPSSDSPSHASDLLSKVIHCSNQQASDPAGWDAAGLDRATLVDLILAAAQDSRT